MISQFLLWATSWPAESKPFTARNYIFDRRRIWTSVEPTNITCLQRTIPLLIIYEGSLIQLCKKEIIHNHSTHSVYLAKSGSVAHHNLYLRVYGLPFSSNPDICGARSKIDNVIEILDSEPPIGSLFYISEGHQLLYMYCYNYPHR